MAEEKDVPEWLRDLEASLGISGDGDGPPAAEKPKGPEPLKEPLFNATKITPFKRKKFVVVSVGEGGGSCFEPPDYVAELTTYAIELSPKAVSADARAREDLRDSFERWLKQVRWEEKLDLYDEKDPDMPFRVTVEGEPPVFKVQGLTLDQLSGLIKYNLLESNIDVAGAFAGAAKVEYRSPLMLTDKYYEFDATADSFERKPSGGEDGTTSIGDLIAAEPGQEYKHAVDSLRRGLATGMIRGKDGFSRAAWLVAANTLSGLLPSPYPTAQKLLGDGESNDDENRKRIVTERLRQVVSDAIGDDLGQATWHSHVGRVKREEKSRIVEKEEARRVADEESARRWAEDMKAHPERYTAAPFDPEKHAERIAKIFDTWNRIEDPVFGKKHEIKERLRGQRALQITGGPESRNEGHDPTFFGVVHRLPVYTLEKVKTYETRNPDIDPPRKIPKSLYLLLKREARKGPPRLGEPRNSGAAEGMRL